MHDMAQLLYFLILLPGLQRLEVTTGSNAHISFQYPCKLTYCALFVQEK